MKKIAISVQTEVQYYSIEPLLRELGKHCDFELIIDNNLERMDKGMSELSRNLIKIIKNDNYPFLTTDKLEGKEYDFWLAPYVDYYCKAKYFLKYEYGSTNCKPSRTYKFNNMGSFHGFLCSTTITASMLSAYGKTFLVDNLKFSDEPDKELIEKLKKIKKKKLLLAPTFTRKADFSDEYVNAIDELKKDYCVIVKGHHATNYRNDKRSQKDALLKMADIYLDSSTKLADILRLVDVCLTGNSSAIGEALYCETPCAIFADNLDEYELGGVHTTQYHYHERNICPWTNKTEEITKIIEKAQSKEIRDNIHKESLRIFRKDGTKSWLEAIDWFLNDQDAEDYLKFLDWKINECRKKFNRLAELEKAQKGYEEGKLYRAARKIYDFKRRIHGES